MWKPLPSRRVLKTLRENPKEKTQRGQYLLAVDLGCYTCDPRPDPRLQTYTCTNVFEYKRKSVFCGFFHSMFLISFVALTDEKQEGCSDDRSSTA